MPFLIQALWEVSQLCSAGILLHGSGLRGWQQDQRADQRCLSVHLHRQVTSQNNPGALKPKPGAEAIITLPPVRAQINASPSLSFLQLFLEFWDLGTPVALSFPAPLSTPVLCCPLSQVGLVIRSQHSSPASHLRLWELQEKAAN